MLENYAKNQDGVIYQVNKNPIDYNKTYIENSYVRYGELTNYMAYLRLGNIIGSLGRIPKSILDVGYGDGSFLNVCSKIIPKCYGHDISSYPIPYGCEGVDNIEENFYDVITFFDSLEHFEDIEFVKNLKCSALCISVPNCHHTSDSWFEEWKHRRVNEHLWHFNQRSLINFMERVGFILVSSTNIEDTIRKNKKEETNILTCVFRKK
jgi:hypothetical protein